MEVGWIMVSSSQRINREDLITDDFSYLEEERRLTTMEVGWIMVRRSKRVNRWWCRHPCRRVPTKYFYSG
jgi:hypothetical protein